MSRRDATPRETSRPATRGSATPRPQQGPTGDKPSRADAAPASVDDGRGRHARTPLQIPAPGWKDILLRVKEETKADNLSLVAAGVAFYFMLSIFPALIATISVYGLVADPLTVEKQVGQLLAILPPEAGALLSGQLREIGHGAEAGLGISLVVSIALAVWSAAKGAKALMAGLNIAYEEVESRGIVRQQLVALGFTFGFVVFAGISLGLITVVPNVVERLPLGRLGTNASLALTWLLVVVVMLGGLAAVYRYGPARNNARWTWVSIGSAVAAVLWLVASLLFSWYASRFGSFNETYGTLAGGVLLLLWLQITAYVTLLGAELNAEIEHQTAVDSTVGSPKPMGERNATMADTLGAALGAARGDEDDEEQEEVDRRSRSRRHGGTAGSEKPRRDRLS